MAVARLVDRARTTLGDPVVLDSTGRQLAGVFTRRVKCGEPRRSVVPCQLLRGGCLRAVVGGSAANGSGMGARRVRTRLEGHLRGKRALPPGGTRRRYRPRANARRGVAMDGQS